MDGLFRLLTDPAAVEWRDRVGVVGRRDGSAKPTTRLLCSSGWVVKTCLDDVLPSGEAQRRRVVEVRAPGLRAEVWHPAKQWALLHGPAGWYPVTLCPELRTLRQIEAVDRRMQGWLEMVRMALRVHAHHGIGLDLNPSNFATADGQLVYLDDECYSALSEQQVAGALVARIPEEPDVPADGWEAWGALLVQQLGPELAPLSWERLSEELERYPVAHQFEGRRAALAAPVLAQVAAVARGRRGARRARVAPRLTCVLADVHANLPALEATLASAAALGADSYLFIGDAVGYGPHPDECIVRLAELTNASLLRGNHDHAIGWGEFDTGMSSLARRCAEWTRSVLGPAELEWLATLPLEHADDGWMAVHGAPRDPRRFLAYVYELTYEDNLRYLASRHVRTCFHGHTHVQLAYADRPAGPTKVLPSEPLDLSARGPFLVNPGSVGQPRDGDPRAAFALWHRGSGRVAFHRVAYDVDRTLRDLDARELPVQLGQRLRTGT